VIRRESSPVTSRVRIIGGEWRSRLISFPAARVLRPTPDRVRETLFNWLGQDLTGLACLDLFAGSGVLGFEAASRGAVRVTLVDASRAVCANLRRNADNLRPNGLEVVCADALQFLASRECGYDIAFVDPPYHKGWIERIVPLLSRVMLADALVYVEAEHALADSAGWAVIRRGRAGQVHFHLLRAGTS